MKIDRDGPVPPYKQLAQILRDRIAAGDIAPGRRIPSVTELEQETGLARDTIQKAVRLLREEGLVETVIGMGVFVVDRES
jgi:GntR family transcriptional regulator